MSAFHIEGKITLLGEQYSYFMSQLNNIRIELQEKTKEKAKKNGNSVPMEKTITGTYHMNGSPQFSADLKTEASVFHMNCDEPSVLGGPAINPTPLTYLLFGVMACYSSSLASQCASENIELKELKIRGKLIYDIGPAVIESPNPIIKGLNLEVISDRKLTEQIGRAWKKCPAVFAIQNPIPTDITQVDA